MKNNRIKSAPSSVDSSDVSINKRLEYSKHGSVSSENSTSSLSEVERRNKRGRNVLFDNRKKRDFIGQREKENSPKHKKDKRIEKREYTIRDEEESQASYLYGKKKKRKRKSSSVSEAESIGVRKRRKHGKENLNRDRRINRFTSEEREVYEKEEKNRKIERNNHIKNRIIDRDKFDYPTKKHNEQKNHQTQEKKRSSSEKNYRYRNYKKEQSYNGKQKGRTPSLSLSSLEEASIERRKKKIQKEKRDKSSDLSDSSKSSKNSMSRRGSSSSSIQSETVKSSSDSSTSSSTEQVTKRKSNHSTSSESERKSDNNSSNSSRSNSSNSSRSNSSSRSSSNSSGRSSSNSSGRSSSNSSGRSSSNSNSSSNSSSSSSSSSGSSGSSSSSDNKNKKVEEEEEEEEEYDPVKEDEQSKIELNQELIEYAKSKIANVTREDIGKTGGVYIPPFKLERLQAEVTDKTSVEYQRQEWIKLKKKINNIVNKVNVDNISEVCYELFECNLIRGVGLFSRALIHAQLSSPAFTNVFACLLCIINSKFPNIGLLTIQRVIIHFRRSFKRNDKILCYNCVKFIAHMINQRLLHEVTGLQLCSMLLKNVTNDSVQICIFFLKEVGNLYMEICRKGIDLIFDRLKDIIQEGTIHKKTQYDIEKLWDLRKESFKDFPPVIEKLDLLEEEDKIVHEVDLFDETFTSQEELNIFKEVPYEKYMEENEEWKKISEELVYGNENDKAKKTNSDKESENDSNSSVDSEEQELESNNDADSNEEQEEEEDEKEEITDLREQYLISLRKSVYLSIMSSLSFEECVHKLLKLNIKKGYEIEVCNMLIDCCCMDKTFQTFYALQAERLCKLRKIYQDCFEKCFETSYNTAHRLETAKLRNCSKFFAHLLYSDAISWSVFTIIQLTEETTSSSTRIFIKILLQELTNNLGLKQLYLKINHPVISPYMGGLFPKDSAQNIRFCINFFTAIGLGALTVSMRKLLQN